MVGIIRRREQVKEIPVFDPITHIATEKNFMKLLDNGVYDSHYIGYKVQLSNSIDYNNGLWIIADVNHDSENTGQTNCYDLISEDCFHKIAFSGSSVNWRDSSPRTWLNNTFYPGFSTEFKNHILNPKYKTKYGQYNDDRVILPSFTEVNGGTSSYAAVEGTAYPIFLIGTAGTSANTSRVKNYNGTTSTQWTRSINSSYNSGIWYVNTDGSVTKIQVYYSNYLAPILRVS